MASGVCCVLMKPLLYHHHCGAVKKSQVANLDANELSCQATSSKVAKMFRPRNLIDLNIVVKSKCQDFLLVSCQQHLCVSEAHFFAESFCRHMKIVGYWIGPDIEDGCGYVEATLTETLL
ncbi:hypothetical protein IHE45_07G036900 [Dioscorea alata]|uniref:Uncharacterized protein n=1 Tax=Dioscorea alata TaxID=55571 RepID=A0ACB7VQ39_DIOAL|nr:hypothetical protein IHE45_07G036900 [Dioscorea alata]